MAATPSVRTREAGTSKPIRRSWRGRIGLSHVLIAVTAILAFFLNFLALQNRDETVMVVVAGGNIAQGSPLSSEVVRLEPIPATFSGIDNLLTEDRLDDMVGAVASRALTEGQLLDDSAFVLPGSDTGLRSMSIPVALEHAAGGFLRVGDRVDVISVVDGSARFVGTDLEVLEIPDQSSNGRLSGSNAFHVVVGVNPDEALDLAAAIDNGSVELIRSTGAEAIEGP